jgi:hypothetical protein
LASSDTEKLVRGAIYESGLAIGRGISLEVRKTGGQRLAAND